MNFYEKIIKKYPVYIICFFIVILLASSYKLNTLKVILYTDDLLTSNYKTYNALVKIKEDFKQKESTYLVVENPNLNNPTWSATDFCQFRKWTNQYLNEHDYIDSSFSIFNLRVPLEKINNITYPYLLNLDCLNKNLNELKIPPNPWNHLLATDRQKDININFFHNPFDANKTTIFNNNPEAYNEASHLMSSFKENFPKIQHFWYGTVVYQYYLKLGYDQTNQLNLMVIVFIFIVFKLFFGTFRSSLIFIITLILTCWLVYNFMTFMGYSIDILSNSLFLMLIIGTIEDFVYLSCLKQDLHEESNIIIPYSRLVTPCFFTSLTTIVGFGSLAVSGLDIIKHFGIITAFGSFTEWFLLFIILPAVCIKFPIVNQWTKSKSNTSIKKLMPVLNWVPPRAFSKILLLAIPLGLFSINKLHINDNPNLLFPKNHPYTKTVDYIKKNRGYESLVDIIFTKDTTPAEIKLILEKIKSNISQVIIIDDYRSKLDYLTRDISPIHHNLIEEDIKDTPIGHYYFSKHNQEKATIYFDTGDNDKLLKFQTIIDQICLKKCELGGTFISYAEIGNQIPKSLMESLITSITLVILILLILLNKHKIKNKLLIILTSIWGPAAIILVLYLAKIKIYFPTSIFASILVGLAGDNTIQFIYAAIDSEKNPKSDFNMAVTSRAVPSVIFGICLVSIPFVFIFSYFRPIQSLGYIFTIGSLLLIFGDFWLLKGVLKR
jgi:predicted RND superfamily exporter protein